MLHKFKYFHTSYLINESFKNTVNIARKAAKKSSLLTDTDVFHNLLANASSILYTKTHKYEHNCTLMRNPIGYFTKTFKNIVYDYIDSFREIYNIAQRKTNKHVSNIAIFRRMIDGEILNVNLY